MTDSRPGTAYSDNHTPRQLPAFSAPLPSGTEYTPYQAYNFPQPSYPPSMMLPHPSALPSASSHDFEFFNPLSAKSVGITLESFQVVSGMGTKKPEEGGGSGGGMSRSSSISASASFEALHTPPPPAPANMDGAMEGEEDGEGEQDPGM